MYIDRNSIRLSLSELLSLNFEVCTHHSLSELSEITLLFDFSFYWDRILGQRNGLTKTRRADGSDDGWDGMARRPIRRRYASDGSSPPRSRLRRAT